MKRKIESMNPLLDVLNADVADTIVFIDTGDEQAVAELAEQFPVPEGEEPSFFFDDIGFDDTLIQQEVQVGETTVGSTFAAGQGVDLANDFDFEVQDAASSTRDAFGFGDRSFGVSSFDTSDFFSF